MESPLVESLPPCQPAPFSPSPWGLPPVSDQSSVKSPWSCTAEINSEPVSLKDVMSEELAKKLQSEEEHNAGTVPEMLDHSSSDVSEFLTGDELDTSDDFLLAQMLQREFDKEHDALLQKEKDKTSDEDKVTISFTNYRTIHRKSTDSEESGDENEPVERNERDPVFNFKRNGTMGKGKNITTKHDATICGRRNANKVMEFPPEFDSGDIRGSDVKLNNKVYNKLKMHSIAEEKRSARLHEKKEHSTAEQAVDPKTRLILYKLVNAEVLENINGIISTGKESVVFHAFGGHCSKINSPNLKLPSECAIKVFKTTLNEFHTRERYVRGDYRFGKDEFKKQNPRKIIRIWAEKEMMNLRKMRRCGLNCPDPLLLKKHVLLMSFIGKDQAAAPKLKTVRLSTEDWEDAYDQTLQIMKKMHEECHLVHADLSEYNLLWHAGKVWIIDVSQAVDLNHSHSLEFLLRDCRNISEFFTRKGVHNVPNTFDLFNQITGLGLQGEGEEFLAQIQDYEKSEEWIANDKTRKEISFDYFFDLATSERQAHKLAMSSEEDSSQD